LIYIRFDSWGNGRAISVPLPVPKSTISSSIAIGARLLGVQRERGKEILGDAVPLLFDISTIYSAMDLELMNSNSKSLLDSFSVLIEESFQAIKDVYIINVWHHYQKIS
jgi:hypothetical protein